MIHIPKITQADIDRVAAFRARLEPIATMVGLSYMDGDEELIDALHVIEKRRAKTKATTSAPARGGQSALTAAVAAMSGAKPCQGAQDFGDQVAAAMAARRGRALSDAIGDLERGKP